MAIFDWLRRMKNGLPPAEPAPSHIPRSNVSLYSKTNWHKHPAHLYLLSRFLNGCSAEQFESADYLANGLGESPSRAVKHLLAEGLIEPASVHVALSCMFQAKDLKAMLKQRDLKVSGKKEELAARLIEYDIEGMKQVVKGSPIFRCTDAGAALARDFLQERENRHVQARQKVFAALLKKDFHAATKAMAAFEASEVVPRGMNCDWQRYDPTQDVAKMKIIFSETPQILQKVPAKKLDVLRLVAAEMLLWGKDRDLFSLPADFETDIHLDPPTAARMILFFIGNRQQFHNCSDLGIEKVEWCASSSSCPACSKLHGRKFRLSAVPEAPCPQCTHAKGCRCLILPYIPV